MDRWRTKDVKRKSAQNKYSRADRVEGGRIKTKLKVAEQFRGRSRDTIYQRVYTYCGRQKGMCRVGEKPGAFVSCRVEDVCVYDSTVPFFKWITFVNWICCNGHFITQTFDLCNITVWLQIWKIRKLKDFRIHYSTVFPGDKVILLYKYNNKKALFLMSLIGHI